MLITTALFPVVFNVLNIYCSVIGIFGIIIMYHNILVATCIKYDHKGKISENQTINFSILFICWMLILGC